jgi:hypothetical protein
MGISANISYVKGKATVSYVELNAVVDLNTNVLNKYFTVDNNSPEALTVTIGDAPAISFSRPVFDSFGMSDSPAIAFSRPASDSFGMSDSLVTALIYLRAFADTSSISEALVLTSFEKVLSDAFTMDDTTSVSDDLKTDVALNKNNVVSISETSAINFTSPQSDSATLSELLQVQLIESVGFSRFNESIVNTFMFNE